MFFSSSHSHDPRTMEDFYRPSLIGRGGPITPTTVPGTDFVLKNYMVRLLRQNCQFHGFRDEDANEHLDKYLSITQFMKQNGVSQDIINLNLFPFSLTHEAESWFYHLKTHSIYTWEEMILKFLSKYYPHSRALQLRKDIMNFWQLPMESVFEAWERFKSCLRKCPNHRILLLNQILTFYYGITMIDQERLMVAAGGNFMRKTLQEAYHLIENMTRHHFQWDAEVYYDTTTGMSAHYSETTSALSAQIEVLGKQTTYTIQSVQHQPGLGHPNTVYYSDNSDEDEPYEVDSLLEETDTLLSYIDDSFPECETFSFDIEEKSSGNTTTHSDYSLLDYDAIYFDDDHIEEKSSGSTTTHFDFSLPDYDAFYFDDDHIEEKSSGSTTTHSMRSSPINSLTSYLHQNSTKELTSPELNDFPFLLSDCDSTFSEEFSEIDFLVSFPSGNKDKIFDPGIFIIKRVQSKRFHIFPLDDFSTISVISDFLLLTNPSAIKTFLSFLFGNEDKVFDPGILLINGIFSSTRKSPHLLINNFMIDKYHIFREISLMTESSVSFHPKDKEIQGESS
ncbi:reverse transcriptase domain-containing protein [Tanacetum coccineum]